MFKGKNKRFVALIAVVSLLTAGIIVVSPEIVKAEETMAPTLPEITFSDFGEIDGTYGYNGGADLSLDVSAATGFANKTLVGTVRFTSQTSTAINFAGKDMAWEGVKLVTMGEGQVYFAEAYDKFEAIALDTGVFPLDKDVDIKLSFEVTNIDSDEAEDDVRFWLYIGDVLYNEGPIVEVADYAQYVGNYLGIYSDSEGSGVSITSKKIEKPKVEEPTLPEITFSDFGEIDGTYGYNGGADLSLDVSAATGFANKTLVGTVRFTSQTSTAINFAGKDMAWEGVKLVTMGEGQVYFAEAYDKFEAIALDTGVFPLDKDVDIKLSFEVTNIDSDEAEDDVRFWLYIGDVLYNEGPIVEVADYAQYVGNYLGIYSDSEGSGVSITSKKIEKPKVEEPTLPEITFSDFGEIDGTYGYNGGADLSLDVSASTGFANKTLVGTVRFTSQTSTAINFAGKDMAWEGVKLVTMGEGQVYFAEAYDKFEAIALDTGVFPLDKDVDIKLSFEVTNIDSDEAEDDVRFWLYIGDVLYNEGPIAEVADYAQYVGHYLGIYSDNEKSSVTIRSKGFVITPEQEEKVDFTDVGFSEDWESELADDQVDSLDSIQGDAGVPYTGDQSIAGFFLVVFLISLLSVGILLPHKKYTGKIFS